MGQLKRLMFFGGSREINDDGKPTAHGAAHNATFFHAAKTVAGSYSDWGKAGTVIKISCADALVTKINACAAGTLDSLDVFCHGTPWSLNFSLLNDKNCGIFADRLAYLGYAVVGPFSDGVNSPESRGRRISDIDFGVFADNARVEFHGCQTAKDAFIGDSFAEVFSKALGTAGKNKAIVIGHVDKSNPNIKGAKTTNSQQDYRHGLRVVLRAGKVIWKTSEKGDLSREFVAKNVKI
jgi:hypothetical protein